jgi:acyl carrier protein
MAHQEFLSLLDELLELSPGTLKGSELLGSLEGWDSLAVMSFIAMVDEHSGLTVSPKAIVACKTVDDLAKLAGAQPD